MFFYERVTGIEPVSQPWEGYIIPIYYTRNFSNYSNASLIGQLFKS